MTETPTHEILALRYATQAGRPASANLLLPDDHASPMPIDYFVWAVRGGGRCIAVDTGFGPAAAARRGRTLMRSPADALAAAGIDATAVADVVLTHLRGADGRAGPRGPRARPAGAGPLPRGAGPPGHRAVGPAAG